MPGAQTAVLYRRSNGQPLSILDDNLIGSGGEGSIYTLDERPDLVAKVYHSPSGTIGAKLALMVDNPPNMPALGGHVSIAWPLDTLHSALPVSAGNTVGFLMHKISSMQPVTSAYNPAARKRNFPHYTYKHLCAVAINIAIVVDAIHDRNYVIGDINESNIMVSADGLVTLIDTDSFQVFDQSDGTIYRSPVGKPEYTSPDLQGHRFDQVDRDVYHDRFGLGVIIYQLLLEGIHPYQGRWTGSGEPPAIEGNIASGYFLYSQNKSVPLVEGPGFMPRHALDASIGNLFGLCFETGHDRRTIRPAPDMWEQTITQAVGSLAACPKNSQHLFFRHSPACPWCERRTMRRGRDPFPDYSGSVLEPLIMRSAVDHSANASATQHQPAPWQPQTPPRTQHQPAPPQPQPTPPQPTPPQPQPAPSQPQPAPLQPQPAPLQHQPAPWQPQTQGRRIFAGVSLPSSSWGSGASCLRLSAESASLSGASRASSTSWNSTHLGRMVPCPLRCLFPLLAVPRPAPLNRLLNHPLLCRFPRLLSPLCRLRRRRYPLRPSSRHPRSRLRRLSRSWPLRLLQLRPQLLSRHPLRPSSRHPHASQYPSSRTWLWMWELSHGIRKTLPWETRSRSRWWSRTREAMLLHLGLDTAYSLWQVTPSLYLKEMSMSPAFRRASRPK